KVGDFVGQGLAKGVDQASSLVAYSGENVGSVALNGVQESIANSSDRIHKDLDTTPTIRPGLDLSSVQADSAKLNSMLDSPDISYNKAAAIAARNRASEEALSEDTFNKEDGPTVILQQTNNSPKALSEAEIYRQTKNQISKARG